MLRGFWDRNQRCIAALVGILLFAAAGLMVTSFQRRVKTNPASQAAASKPAGPEAAKKAAAETAAADLPEKQELVLYITGAVRRQGVYRLPVGSRLFRLVGLAGGLSDAADHSAVNLAAPLEDGMHVHVPAKGETSQPRAAYIGVTPQVPVTNKAAGAPKASKAAAQVDVNRASAEELTALRGIGPALAQNIVEYRLKNGRFANVNELLRVKGIGRKKLEQFRESVIIRP